MLYIIIANKDFRSLRLYHTTFLLTPGKSDQVENMDFSIY